MIKIDIVSGFLGAGKTTLIKQLLADTLKDEKVVLIENEFGEIGIDGGFLKDSGIVVNEMNAGCICCSLVGDFGKALHKMVEQYQPDRILIEPSGVGKLSDVIAAVQDARLDARLDVRLNSFVTVVDAQKAKMYLKNFGEFFENQVAYAGAILLTRTAECPAKRLDEVAALLRRLNSQARIVTTPWTQLSSKQLLEVMEGSCSLADEILDEIAHMQAHNACNHERHGHEERGHGHEERGHGHEERGHGHEERGRGHEECGHGHDHVHGADCGCHAHHADEIFTSWGIETPRTFTEDELRVALNGLDDEAMGTVLRAKGMLPCADGGKWLHFDYVPGDIQLHRGAADYTGRLCVIGTSLHPERLAALFGL